MTVSERAGRPAEASMLVDVGRLIRAYYEEQPDPSAAERVSGPRASRA
jgi:phosphoglucomutase